MTYKRTMYKNRQMLGACDSGRIEHSFAPQAEITVIRTDSSKSYPSLAAVYGVDQRWRDINDGCEGFERGTIFSELNKPFKGDKCKNGGYCK